MCQQEWDIFVSSTCLAVACSVCCCIDIFPNYNCYIFFFQKTYPFLSRIAISLICGRVNVAALEHRDRGPCLSASYLLRRALHYARGRISWSASLSRHQLKISCDKNCSSAVLFTNFMWKADISFVMSVYPNGTSWLPLNGFTGNLIF
jgi:hypothetical protein